jgi:hypothetical protein
MNKLFKFIFLIPYLLIGFSINAQNKAFKDFVSTVDSIYSNLTFNDVSLKDIRVDLKNHNNGVAFAYENPKNGKKYILINYQYLFRKVWQNDKYKDFEVEINKVKKRVDIRKPIIKGILTHEWTHHFLNHSLRSPSILNERNADILSGRIMQEDIRQNDNEYLIDAVVRLFSDLPKDKHHLIDTIRRNMIFKGRQTHEVIKANSDLLCKSAEKDSQYELEKAKRNKYSVYEDCHKKEITNERKRLIIFSKNVLSETLLNLLNNRLADTSLHISPLSKSPFLSTNLDIDSVLTFSYKNGNKTVDSIYVKLKNSLKIDSVTKTVQELLNQKLMGLVNIKFSKCQIILNEMNSLNINQFDNDSSTVVEALYNRIYIKQESHRCERIDKLMHPSKLPSQRDIIFYKLNGGLYIEIELKKLLIGKAVSISNNNRPKKFFNFLTFKDNDAKLFKGYFEVGENNKHPEKFYLDNNFHLWTETIAAKSIQNKLFLERFTIK